MNPNTLAHPQRIIGACNIIKAPFKRKRGNETHLQSHVNETSYFMLRLENANKGCLLEAVLKDVPQVHCNSRVMCC